MSQSEPWLRIAPGHPALCGHFPHSPIVPGALLLDQALHSIDASARQWRIASVKFHRIVRPDEALQLAWQASGSGQLRVEIHAAQALVMSALIEAHAP
jgi:3-hydroxymyristoyl/3-hydroxydecanoyl-(acyl carrier protein) dehydratase